jgi:ribokinase
MAVQAARLGAQTGFVGRVGDDDNGTAFRGLLEKEGIDDRHLKHQQHSATGVGFIMVAPDGQNVISIDSGPNADLSHSDIDEAAVSWKEHTVVLTQLEIPLEIALHAMDTGLRRDLTTILNPAPACNLLDQDLSGISVITPNETEARVCLGLTNEGRVDEEELGNRLLNLGCGAAILTLGERGSLCVTRDGSTHVPAFAVPEVVDTTGAGDAFNAALAVALSRGRDLVEATRFANAAAALSCTKLDTLPSYHDNSQVEKILQQT